MEKGIEKNDGLTVESLQQQVDMLQDQVRNLNEEVQSLTEELKKANNAADNLRQWWMNAENQRDAALDLLKSLKTVMAAVDIEPINK